MDDDDDEMICSNEESGRKRENAEKNHANGNYSPESPHGMTRDRSEDP